MRVQVNGTGVVVLDGGQVSAGDQAAQPEVKKRRRDGSIDTDAGDGTTLASVVRLAGVDPAHVDGLDVGGPSGAIAITPSELTDGFTGDPDAGRLFATIKSPFYDGVRFFRPLRDPSDVNAPDFFSRPVITLAVRTDGQTLAVGARGTPDELQPGEPVSFSATVADRPSGASLSYTWRFGDGTEVTEPRGTTTHRYRDDGTYQAYVTVAATQADGKQAAGVSDPIPIRVGAAPRVTPTATSEPGPAGPSSGDGNGATGGGGGAPTGGGSGAADQQTSGSRDDTQPDGRGKRPSRRAPSPARSTPAPESPDDPTADPAATSAPGGASGSPNAAAPDDTAPDGSASPAARPSATPAPPAGGRENAISGTLVAGTGPEAQIGDLLAAAGAAPELAAAPTRAGGGSAGGVLAPVGGGLAVLALLAAGALRERGVRLAVRRLRPW